MTRPDLVKPNSRSWSPEKIQQLVDLAAAGLTGAQIAERLGEGRNAIMGQLHRLRQAKHPGVPPAGRSAVVDRKTLRRERADALAELMAEGADTVPSAGAKLGMSRWTTIELWGAIRAGLGPQAR